MHRKHNGIRVLHKSSSRRINCILFSSQWLIKWNVMCAMLIIMHKYFFRSYPIIISIVHGRRRREGRWAKIFCWCWTFLKGLMTLMVKRHNLIRQIFIFILLFLEKNTSILTIQIASISQNIKFSFFLISSLGMYTLHDEHTFFICNFKKRGKGGSFAYIERCLHSQ